MSLKNSLFFLKKMYHRNKSTIFNFLFFKLKMSNHCAIALKTVNGQIYQATISKHLLFLAAHIDILQAHKPTLCYILNLFKAKQTPIAFPVECGLLFIDQTQQIVYNLQSYRNPWNMWMGYSESQRPSALLQNPYIFPQYPFAFQNITFNYVVLRAFLTNSLIFPDGSKPPSFFSREHFLEYLRALAPKEDSSIDILFSPKNWIIKNSLHKPNSLINDIASFFDNDKKYYGTSLLGNQNKLIDIQHAIEHWNVFLHKTTPQYEEQLNQQIHKIIEKRLINQNIEEHYISINQSLRTKHSPWHSLTL